MATLPADALGAGLALLAGYLVGSIPLAAWVGRAAGVEVARAGEADPGPAGIWRLAGPGWGLLALTGDLAKGVLPVALATVTFSWAAGWVAGLGALSGAWWPIFGRRARGCSVAVFAGVAFTLSPGAVGAVLALAVALVARVVGRDGRVAAVAAGILSYPLLFLADQADLRRLTAVTTLCLVALLLAVTTRR